MSKTDFVVVGSGGGGGTIAWLLAKAGYRVALLEQGRDITAEYMARKGGADPDGFNSAFHSEHDFRIRKPDPKRRLRGDYNTFRRTGNEAARPFANGWTASTLGGGSTIWGTWSYRPLPVDFQLNKFYQEQQQLSGLSAEGYAIPDWPIQYSELLPYLRVAEALMGVSGDRRATKEAIGQSKWYRAFGNRYGDELEWFDADCPLPCDAYPITPVGHFVEKGMRLAGFHPVPLPCAIVRPGGEPFNTREAIAKTLQSWNGERPDFWRNSVEQIWSDAQRKACNLCGFCGEYLCWGQEEAPKFGTRVTTLRELSINSNAAIICNAKAIEIMTTPDYRRATGVRYLDLRDPDQPLVKVIEADHVIVSCGAVQSARLLRLSGPPTGLGNEADQLGRYAMFHLFGLGSKILLHRDFQGLLHGEFGPTGNVTCYDPYFLQDANTGEWIKCGTLTSTAKKNPLENVISYFDKTKGAALGALREMEKYARGLEMRMTADDLPMTNNRVDLDPRHVDEYGIPVARITRDLGPNEWRMYSLARAQMLEAMKPYSRRGQSIVEKLDISPAITDLVGDHQMGTCRMGTDPASSVLDIHCRLHRTPNVFVVDSSFMPTGFGLNPMLTVVANALRVGSWIVQQDKQGRPI